MFLNDRRRRLWAEGRAGDGGLTAARPADGPDQGSGVAGEKNNVHCLIAAPLSPGFRGRSQSTTIFASEGCRRYRSPPRRHDATSPNSCVRARDVHVWPVRAPLGRIFPSLRSQNSKKMHTIATTSLTARKCARGCQRVFEDNGGPRSFKSCFRRSRFPPTSACIVGI